MRSCIKKRNLANGLNSFNEFSDHINAIMGRIRIHLIVNLKKSSVSSSCLKHLHDVSKPRFDSGSFRFFFFL